MQHVALEIDQYTASLLPEEQIQFHRFCELAYKTRIDKGATAPDPIDLAGKVGINLSSLNKISNLGPHVWIAFLSIFSEVETLASVVNVAY